MKMVYYCSVKGCKNNSKMKKKDPNIVLSFHAFPVKEATKQKWLRAIGRPSWKPPSFARICSSHFDFDQISHEGCRIRMMDDACPVNRLPPNSNFEASNIEVCRICLATDLKMFSLQGLLNTCLQSLAALKDNCSIDGLPLFVCYECSARLIKCYNLIEQSSIAQAVLLDLFTKNGQVTKSLVKKQDRKALGLESSLQYHTTNLVEFSFNHKEYSIENLPNKNETDSSNTEAIEYLSRQLEIDEKEKKTSKHNEDELHRKLVKNEDNLIITEGKISAKKEIHEVNKPEESLTYKNPMHRVRKSYKSSDARNSVSDSSDDFKMESHVETEMFDNVDDEKAARKFGDPDVDRPKYTCAECDTNTNFVSEEAKRVHLITAKKHRKKPDLCDPTPNPLRGACNKCGIQFQTTRELISHLRSDHPRAKRLRRSDGYPVKCEHCEEIIDGRWQHWLHVRRRHPDKKHSYRAEHNSVCQRCGKQFQNSTKLRMHELHHGPAALRCGECARAFHDKYALARHAHTHARAKYACALCAHAFRTKHNLARHQRVHTGETPYSCNLCGKRFKHSTSQQLHVRSVHCNLPAPKRNR